MSSKSAQTKPCPSCGLPVSLHTARREIARIPFAPVTSRWLPGSRRCPHCNAQLFSQDRHWIWILGLAGGFAGLVVLGTLFGLSPLGIALVVGLRAMIIGLAGIIFDH